MTKPKVLTVALAVLLTCLGRTGTAGEWTVSRLTALSGDEVSTAWSPDGRRIAYISTEAVGYMGDLHVLEIATGSDSVIYHGASYEGLQWVDSYIFFIRRFSASRPGDGTENEVWKVRPDGTDPMQVTFTYTNGIDGHIWGQDGFGTVNSFHVSPDGSKLAFVAHHGNGWFDPYVCNTDGTDGALLLQDTSHSLYIKFNAGGSRIYYAAGSDYYPPQSMYRCNLDGSGDETITSGLPCATDFVLSPTSTEAGWSC